MGSGSRFRGLKGWLAACLSATTALYAITLLLFIVAPSLAMGTNRAMAVSGQGVMISLMLFPFILVVVCLVSAIPAAFAVAVAESFRIRAASFFGCAGG